MTAVSCQPGAVDISFSHISGAESLLPGSILAGSSELWACPNAAGENMPFTKGVVSVGGLVLTLLVGASPYTALVPGDLVAAFVHAYSRTGDSVDVAFASLGISLPSTGTGVVVVANAVIHLLTEDVPPTHCFERMTLNFHRSAGAGEVELRRRLQVCAEVYWACRIFGCIRHSACTNSSPPTPQQTNDTYAEEVFAHARQLGLFDGVWGQNFLWERYLVKMNFDSSARQPIPSTQSILGSIVYCANCVSSAASLPSLHVCKRTDCNFRSSAVCLHRRKH